VAWAGVLVAIWGLGSLAGGLLYGSRDWGGPAERRAMACLALFGAALMLLAAAHGLLVLALLMIPLGAPLSPWLGALSASVQRAVPSGWTCLTRRRWSPAERCLRVRLQAHYAREPGPSLTAWLPDT
jgi:hypothetical protein